MIASVIAWCMAALEEPETGLNATRYALPLTDGQSPPPAAALFSQNESAWVARAIIPREVLTRQPVVLLRQAGEYEAPFLPDDPAPATIDVALIAAIRDDATHVQLQQLEQLLRTALRVLAVAADTADPVITRDGLEFQPLGRVTFLPPAVTADTPLMTGVVVSFQGTDPWSLGG